MMEQENPTAGADPGKLWQLLETVAVALTCTAFFHFCYYLLAPWIWSQNIPYNPADLTEWIPTGEHDGVEIYALYILMFANGITVWGCAGLVGSCRQQAWRRGFGALCLVFSLLYFATVGFIPPMSTLQSAPFVLWKPLCVTAMVFLPLALLHFLYRRFPRWALALAALLLVMPCFVASGPISWLDYSYIFAPASRIVQGAPWHDIYFQYDLYPSLLAAGWMQLGLDLNTFQILGQASYFGAILGVFLFSRRLFRKKELSLLLLASLVLGRIYTGPWDIVQVFQVTPIRLDLWLVLLVAVYLLGPLHWAVALICGALLVLAKNLGIIYTLAYFQLLLTLFAIEYCDGDRKSPLLNSLSGYLKRCLKPLAIIICCYAASYLLLHNNDYPDFAGYYQKIGIGFIRIASHSFYWYVPAVFGVATVLLLRLRTRVSPQYLTCGFLLIYLAIGNSVYFFGRSHENNILNIAIVLLFVFFFLLDLCSVFVEHDLDSRDSFPFIRRHGALMAAGAVLLTQIVFYSDNILNKFFTQMDGLTHRQLIYPCPEQPGPVADYLKQVRAAIGNSSKVYFVDRDDFALYYYGGYRLRGYCNPFQTWLFTRDLHSFLQKLLDDGYYLICDKALAHHLSTLKYDNESVSGEMIVASKSAILKP
jgi:hypothetical protein